MKKKGIIGLLFLLIFYFLITVSLEKCGEEKEKYKEYKGTVDSIFLDAKNRNQYTYKIQTFQGIINQTAYNGSFNYIEIGDSIIKKKGELMIIIKKKKYGFNRMASFYYNE